MHLLESTIAVWTRSIKEVLATSPDTNLEVCSANAKDARFAGDDVLA